MPSRHAKALSVPLTAGALLLAIVPTASLPAAAQGFKAIAGGVDVEAVTDSPAGDEAEAAEEATGDEPLTEAEDLLVTPDEARVPNVASRASLAREKAIDELLNRLRTEDMERPQLKLLTTRLRRSCQLALSEMSIMLAQASMLRRELDAEARDLRRKHSRILAELSSGHYIPAEVKDAVRGLAAEANRYDGLFQEAIAAREGLDPRIQAAQDLAFAALEYVRELETAEDSPLGRTVEDRELLQRIKDATHDLDTRVTTIRSLAKALAEIGDTCAENAALAAEGLVAIHQALAGSDQRGLLQPVSTRLSRETLVRAGHDLQQIPTGIAIALSPPAGGSWLDILPTRLGSVEEVGARALAAAILLAIAIAGWRAGPAKLRAYVGDETEGSADIVALLALIRAIALYLVGLAAIALLALTHAWSALLGTVLAWAALWVLWSGALGAALRCQAVGEGLEARTLAHTFHWSGVLLLWSAVCGIVLRGLAAFGYSAGDVIYGLQLLYAVAACAVVLVLVGYHGGPLAALPATGHVLGRLRGAARQANAGAAVLAVALLGTLIAGYANLSVFFASRLALTVLVAAIAIWGHLRARALLSARLPTPAPDDASDEDDRLADRAWVRRAVLIGAAVVIIAIAAVLIGRIWGIRGWHVSQAIAFLSRPVISIGGTPISVVSVLQGMIVVALAMALGRWLRARLVRSAVLAMRYDAGVRHAIAKVTYYAVVVAGAALGFRVAGLELTAALAVSAGIVGIAVGFGSQHIASNFIAGIILTFDRSIDVGDYIEVGGQQGTILQISLRSTTIGTPDNRTVIIPNSSLIGQNVVGTTQRDRRVRLLVDVAVAGDSDPDKVASVLKETALHTDGIIAEPPPEAWITKLAAANLTFQLAAWTDDPQHQDRIRGILTTAVGKALKENEIKVA